MKVLMVERHSNEFLVTRSQRGDRAAFDELVESHEERIRLFVVSRVKLHLGPRLEADEILQETFTRAYESISQFQWQGEDSFFHWLCGIAKHVLMKTARKFRKTESLDNAYDVPASEVSPSKVLRREERLDRLQKSIEDLPPDYRRVIEMARIQGLKIKEIAEQLGRSPESVKSLLARAVARLRDRFGDTESLHLPDQGLQYEGDDRDEQ